MNTYSNNERKLFAAFYLSHLMSHLSPPRLYRLAADEAFRRNLKGAHVEALRRAVNAIDKSEPYRLTPEFETLIAFKKDKKQEQAITEEICS